MNSVTPYLERQIPEFNGQRVFLPSDQQAQYLGGKNPVPRSWHPHSVPAQGVDPKPEFELPLLSWHAGAGFSYAGLPNTYEAADGWDLSAPGRAVTWERHATGTTFSSATNNRGFLVFHNAKLYLLRGRYAYRYDISTTHGSSWAAVLSKDFGAGNVVSGKPAIFKGVLYVPLVNGSGVEQRFWQLTTPATDTWTEGPVGVTARCFVTWQDKLARASLNTVYTVAANPMAGGDWSAGESISSTTEYITQFQRYFQYLMVWTNKGLYSLDENLRSSDELPDLMTAADSYNGVGSAFTNGAVLAPHQSGLIYWSGGDYAVVGPNQERALEGALSVAWGRAAGVCAFNRYAFVTANNVSQARGFLYGLEPGGERKPLTPHCYQQTASGYFEDMCVIQDAVETRSYLAIIRVDSATGLTTQPYIYQLPRDGYTPGTDPTIRTDRTTYSFTSPRYFQPGREVQKTYRVVEAYLEFSAQSGHPGLELSAHVNNTSIGALLDASGATKTAFTNGLHQFYFPQTAPAVGNHVRLTFQNGSGGGSAVTVTIRDVKLRGDLDPILTEVVDFALVFCDGQFPDGTSERGSAQNRMESILALANPQAAPINVKDIWGNTYRAKVIVDTYHETDFGQYGGRGFVLTGQLRKRKYA